MKRVLRLSSALVLLLMGLAIVAWLVVTKTNAAGQIGATVYNAENEQLRLEIGDARLASGLLGGQLSGLVLSEAKGGHEVLRLDTASVALAEFPSTERVNIENVTIKGLRLRIDDESGAQIQENLAAWRGASEEDARGGAGQGGEDEGVEQTITQLGHVELSDIDVDLRRGDWRLTAPRTSLLLSGVTGPETDVDFVLDAAPMHAKGPAVEARTGLLHAEASFQSTPAASEGRLTIATLSIDTLEAMGATLKGLRLSALALQISGLSATLKLGELAFDATTLLGLSLTKGALAMSLSGSLSGARMDSLRLRSSELNLDLKGSAGLSIGFSGRKLPYTLTGRFDVNPSRLSPGRCPRGGTVRGTFTLHGDLLAREHRVEPMDLSWSPPTTSEGSNAAQRWRLDERRLDRLADWLSIPAWLCPPALPTPSTPDERDLGDPSSGTPTGT